MPEQSRNDSAGNAAALLSTTGALVLGVGLGALLADRLAPIGWPLAGIGLLAHVWGMAAGRRALASEGHRFASWETWGYRLCWALIAVGAAVAVWALVRR